MSNFTSKSQTDLLMIESSEISDLFLQKMNDSPGNFQISKEIESNYHFIHPELFGKYQQIFSPGLQS
jgi:hypothetical protein